MANKKICLIGADLVYQVCFTFLLYNVLRAIAMRKKNTVF